MASLQRVERMREFIRDEVGQILQRGLKDPRIGFVSVTDVELSRDLRHAKIFVSVFGTPEEREQTMQGLASATGFVRTELARRLRVHHAPEIEFRLDDSIERGTRVMQLLRELGAGRADTGEGDR
ncbi:MAG: 30S ribosome-binding factor RbfA [Armatimonadota bacterium]|nr:30S ribosome-binding factor RbfA [Armatimonadota bacterium]MDR5697575.1 30S ribosome-binding factor RbfA [Armatimonadota bacterium]